MLALSLKDGNADPSTDVLANDNNWDDMWE